jgi:hypothetical protein
MSLSSRGGRGSKTHDRRTDPARARSAPAPPGIEPFAHVGGARRQPHPGARRQTVHRNSSITCRSVSELTSPRRRTRAPQPNAISAAAAWTPGPPATRSVSSEERMALDFFRIRGRECFDVRGRRVVLQTRCGEWRCVVCCSKQVRSGLFAGGGSLERTRLWSPNSLLAGKIQGISGIRAQMGPNIFMRKRLRTS